MVRMMFCAGLLALLGMGAVWGQDGALALDISGSGEHDSVRVDMRAAMDQVVVTATRTPRPLKEVPVITQVVTRREIERITPRSANDILELALPGVQTSRHGQQERMTIQGLSSDYFLIMVDGVPLSVDDGSVDLNRIDPNSIERVEVVQGASSALYGSAAIGAVINFITRKGEAPFEATVKGTYDFRGEQLYNGFSSFRSKGFRSTTSGGFTNSANYKLWFPDTKNEGRRVGVLVPGAQTWNVRQYLSYMPQDERLKVDVRGSYSHRMQNVDEKEGYLYGTLNLGSGLLYKLSDRYDFDFSYNLESYKRDLLWILAKERELVFSFRTHNGRLQFNAKPFGVKGPVFNLGIQALEEGLRSTRLSEGKGRYSSTTNTLYGQTDIDLVRGLRLTLGARMDFHTAFGAHITPRAALLWDLGLVQMRLSYAEGFRSPSLKELYMYWDHQAMFFIKGNENLKPERSRMVIFAPELNVSTLNVTLQGYYNAIIDRIGQRSEEGGRTLRYVNYKGMTQIAGGSAMLRWRIVRGLMASANYAYVYDYVERKDVNGERVNVSSTRPHSVTGGLTYKLLYKFGSTSFDVVGRYSSGFWAGVYDGGREGFVREYFEGYGNLRASVTQSWQNYINVTFGCENVLDYKPNRLDVATSLTPGRSFYLAFSLNI